MKDDSPKPIDARLIWYSDEDERNATTLKVLKDRSTGLDTGTTFKLKYDNET